MSTARNSNGFSLIELLIALAVVAIISTVMFNSYHDNIRKSRRAEAMQTLLSMQLEQERYRTNNAQYGNLNTIWGGVSTSSGGNYSLSIANLSATSYTLTATAVGDQINDSANGTLCSPMSITMQDGTETKLPTACWSS